SMGAPTAGQITLTVGTSKLTVPSWLPVPLNLYSDVTKDLGSVAGLPPGCTFVSGGGGTPDHIQRKLQIVDPVVGYIENETVDSYDLVGYTGPVTLGPVCTILTDTLNQYYDYSLLTPYAFYFTLNAAPIITNTIQEQISLTNQGLIAHAVGRNAQQAFAAQLLARQAGITFARALTRAQQIQSMSHAFLTTRGGLK
ncbi:MAG: hypothetical protein M3N13_06505, partial [Candidatus Eremiobacteraeota bacterium]|nr:hypothetical protein [Candidatus Eremiobacteraeota bacterium]